MRHWTFWEWVAYAALFVAAMIVAADTGVRITPDLAAYLPAFVHGPIWGFAPLILVVGATIILVLREFVFRPQREKAGLPQAIPTSLRLQFQANSLNPTCLDINNIANWYSLRNEMQIHEGPSPQYPNGRVITRRFWTLYVVFDHPVSLKQIVFDGNGAQLPTIEVKDRSPRHAVIFISDDMPSCILDLRVII
jgi:hypothetical protein